MIMKETLIEKIEKDAEKMMFEYEGNDFAFSNIFIEWIDEESDGICIGWRYYFSEGCRHYCETYVKSWESWESFKQKITDLNDVLNAVWDAHSEFYKTLDSTGLEKDIVD